jgi:hypothetical protein
LFSDYIARVQDRDRDRMVRSFVAEQRRSAASATSEAMSRSSTSLSPSSVNNKKQFQRFPQFTHSPYSAKSSLAPSKTSQPTKTFPKETKALSPQARDLSKEGSSSSIVERPTSSKSRIPRTTAALHQQKSQISKTEPCQASSVYGYISGKSQGDKNINLQPQTNRLTYKRGGRN